MEFERERHWLADRPQPAAGLAGRRLDLAGGDVVFETVLHPDGWLADHVVAGRPVLPLAALLLMMAEAADGREIHDLAVHRPLAPAAGGTAVQTMVRTDGRVETFARDPDWTLQAEARAVPARAPPPLRCRPMARRWTWRRRGGPGRRPASSMARASACSPNCAAGPTAPSAGWNPPA